MRREQGTNDYDEAIDHFEMALDTASQAVIARLTNELDPERFKEDDERLCTWGLKALGGALTYDS